jgi:hypothetical protein
LLDVLENRASSKSCPLEKQIASMAALVSYQHIVIKGLPYDRGFIHGSQAKTKIRDSLEHYHKPGKLLPW